MSIANIGIDEQDLVTARLRQLEALAFVLTTHESFTETTSPGYASAIFSLYWDLLVEITQALGINKS
ncbi:hypothetical protein AAY72_01455 [Alishewanella sp. WH16-1]|uniref:hypothetical protein n=1 Tax=Alishewanella sp. WH16-1 TaxID=1651088 RepID=UPI00070ABDEE|nr:hypothetical protein [Alishewanella sp. WH16-1]KRS22809.1 hypothetical protein AAY72_01455 [Alishewanella sp. WH16-1]